MSNDPSVPVLLSPAASCMFNTWLQPTEMAGRASGCCTQQISKAGWGCALCRSYLLIKNEGSWILLCFKQISDPEFSGKFPDVVFCGKNFGSFLCSLKIKEEKNLAPGIIAFVSSIYGLLSSAELMAAKWANLKDTFSLVAFKKAMSLDILKNHR